VTRGTGHQREGDASFKAPCKDVNEVGDKFSGANKAQMVDEATEAKRDV
jgi:hypothetical protein